MDWKKWSSQKGLPSFYQVEEGFQNIDHRGIESLLFIHYRAEQY